MRDRDKFASPPAPLPIERGAVSCNCLVGKKKLFNNDSNKCGDYLVGEKKIFNDDSNKCQCRLPSPLEKDKKVRCIKRFVNTKIFFLIMLLANKMFAQDPHYSQIFNTPVYHNPAAAGHNVENIRLTAIYRNQWNSVMNPFTTQGVYFDKQVSKVGFGLDITRNGAGETGITKLNLGGSLSYRQSFGEHQIAAGIYVGLMQKSFDPSKMTFDDQYTEDGGYNANATSGEVFSYTKLTRPDAGAGIFWTRGTQQKEIRFKPFAGIAFSHVNQPKEIFIIEENKVYIKKTFQAGAGYMLKEDVEITPSMMYSTQQFSHEMNAGVKGSIMLENRNKVEAGIYHRQHEAWIAYGGYQWNSLMVGMSYDVGTSEIRHGNSFEITLTYIPKAREKRESSYRKSKDQPEKLPPAKKKIADMDHDGIADSVDKCPDVAGTKALKGCPEKKKQSKSNKTKHRQTIVKQPIFVSEKKSVEVVKEELPVVKEKPVEIVATKPVVIQNPDTDGDGIDDITDACPYIKGGIKTHGCPDSDDDGIIDMKDKCPMAAGTAENKGCPVKKENITSTATKTNNIEFEPGKSVIKGFDVIDILEPASDNLYEDASTTIIITGHTDSEGDEMRNMVLSQNRADAVKEYFMKHGVSSDRIKTIAYGETMPLVINDTEEDKQHNRRVEINILKSVK